MTATDTAASSTTARTPHGLRRTGPRNLVSALWLTVMLSYIYCDVLSNHDPDYMTGILDGTGPVILGQGALLAASVLMTIPILGVLLARIAGHRLARWYSAAAATVMTLVQAASLFVGTTTMYYVYFSVIEITATAAIAWIAIRHWGVDR